MNEYFIDSFGSCITNQDIKSNNHLINILEGTHINDPKAVILNVHGLGSHFQYIYPNLDELVCKDRFFSKFNFKTFGFEFRGHGKSFGTRCYINDFDILLEDLDCVIKFINKKYPNINIFMCAESMGGAVCLKYLISNSQIKYIKGLILLSPLCGIDEHLKPSPLVTNILLILSKIIPKAKLAFTTKKMGSETVINQEFLDAKENCPYGYRGAHRLGTVRELLKISLWLPENVETINYPTIFFHGLHDRITTPSGSIDSFNKIKNKNKELVLFPESEHCLLVPNNYDDLTPNFIYVKILDWIEKNNSIHTT